WRFASPSAATYGWTSLSHGQTPRPERSRPASHGPCPDMQQSPQGWPRLVRKIALRLRIPGALAMLLLPDEEHFRGRVPWVTWCLIVENILVFLIQLAIGEPFTYGFNLIPEEITTGKDLVEPQMARRNLPPPEPRPAKGHTTSRTQVFYAPVPQHPGPKPIQLTLLTSMFMHGSWAHL